MNKLESPGSLPLLLAATCDRAHFFVCKDRPVNKHSDPRSSASPPSENHHQIRSDHQKISPTFITFTFIRSSKTQPHLLNFAGTQEHLAHRTSCLFEWAFMVCVWKLTAPGTPNKMPLKVGLYGLPSILMVLENCLKKCVTKQVSVLPGSMHTVNYAANLVHTTRALSRTITDSHQAPVSGQACNLPNPH